MKENETAGVAAKKMNFYRSLKDSNLITYESGRIKTGISAPVKTLLFSKRDLILKNNKLCKPLGPKTNLSNVYYLLHFPNSFYVLKSGLTNLQNSGKILKKVSPKTEPEKTFTKVKTAQESKDDFGYARSFSIKPRLFFENLKGTQITNATEASISGKLSPGLNLRFAMGEHKDWQYGTSLDLDFHIFDERAGEFLLNNNSVQTIALNLFSNFELHERFSVEFLLSLYEDIYYARVSTTSLGLEKELVPRISAGTDVTIYRRHGFKLKLKPTAFYDLAAGPLTSGFGYNSPLVFEISRKEQIWSFGLDYLFVSKELADLELERSTLSFFLETKVFF